MNLDTQVMESLKAHHINNAIAILTNHFPEAEVKFGSGRIYIGDYIASLPHLSSDETDYLYEHGWHNRNKRWCLDTDLYLVPYMEIVKSILRKKHGDKKVPITSVTDYEFKRVNLSYSDVKEAKIAFFKVLSEKHGVWDLDSYSSILYHYEALVEEATELLEVEKVAQ